MVFGLEYLDPPGKKATVIFSVTPRFNSAGKFLSTIDGFRFLLRLL